MLGIVFLYLLQGQVTWKEASSFCAICYLLSDSCTAVKLKTSWFKHLSVDKKKFYERLYMTGCDRLSQGGKDKGVFRRHDLVVLTKSYL